MDRHNKFSRKWLDQRYLQKNYKTNPCDTSNCKKDFSCPYYHSWADRRRLGGQYKTKGCRHAWDGTLWTDPSEACQNGDACEHAHSRVEMQYHVGKYKTQACREFLRGKDVCQRSIFCAFRHGKDDGLDVIRENQSSKATASDVSLPVVPVKSTVAPETVFGTKSYASIASFGVPSPRSHSNTPPPLDPSENVQLIFVKQSEDLETRLPVRTPSPSPTYCSSRLSVPQSFHENGWVSSDSRSSSSLSDSARALQSNNESLADHRNFPTFSTAASELAWPDPFQYEAEKCHSYNPPVQGEYPVQSPEAMLEKLRRAETDVTQQTTRVFPSLFYCQELSSESKVNSQESSSLFGPYQQARFPVEQPCYSSRLQPEVRRQYSMLPIWMGVSPQKLNMLAIETTQGQDGTLVQAEVPDDRHFETEGNGAGDCHQNTTKISELINGFKLNHQLQVSHDMSEALFEKYVTGVGFLNNGYGIRLPPDDTDAYGQ